MNPVKQQRMKEYKEFLSQYYFKKTFTTIIILTNGATTPAHRFLVLSWYPIIYAEAKIRTTLSQFKKKYALRMRLVRP